MWHSNTTIHQKSVTKMPRATVNMMLPPPCFAECSMFSGHWIISGLSEDQLLSEVENVWRRTGLCSVCGKVRNKNLKQTNMMVRTSTYRFNNVSLWLFSAKDEIFKTWPQWKETVWDCFHLTMFCFRVTPNANLNLKQKVYFFCN